MNKKEKDSTILFLKLNCSMTAPRKYAVAKLKADARKNKLEDVCSQK
jgi:hypothetical protein